VQVHHDDVRRKLADEPHGVGALAGLTGDLDSTLLEQVAQSGAEQVMVVDQQHLDAVRADLILDLDGLAQSVPPFEPGEV
jgi:hypothetical protein